MVGITDLLTVRRSRYSGSMRYPDGGGLAAAKRARRGQVRAAVIMDASGVLCDITAGDVVELVELRRALISAPCRSAPGSTGCCTRWARSDQPRRRCCGNSAQLAGGRPWN